MPPRESGAARDAEAVSERGNASLRAADFYLGVPVVAGLGIARKLQRRVRPQSIRRVGFLRTGGIGDAVLLSGVIQDVAARGGVEVHLFTGEANAAAGRLIPGVSRVTALPMTRPHAAIRRIRETPLDLLIDSGSWPRIDALLTAMAHARWTVGFRTRGQHRHYAYDVVVDHSPSLHEVENFRRLAEAAGYATGALPILADGETLGDDDRPRGDYVVCHMWSGGFRGRHKEWPAEHWASLIACLLEWGYTVLLTGGPETSDATARFRHSLPGPGAGVCNVSGRFSLGQTLTLLRGSRLVVSVNTGIMHMAAAAGVPVLSLEGPVPVHRWGPLGDLAASVVSPHPDAGYLHLGWEYGAAPPDTMRALLPDIVISAAARMLQRSGAA